MLSRVAWAITAAAVVFGVLLGCGAPPDSRTMAEVADELTSQRPWTAGMVKVLLDEDLVNEPQQLASVVMYFQMACTAQKLFGSDGSWSAQKIQRELNEHLTIDVNDWQADTLAATWTTMCIEQPEQAPS